jgi:hypothetical protein
MPLNSTVRVTIAILARASGAHRAYMPMEFDGRLFSGIGSTRIPQGAISGPKADHLHFGF